MKKKFVISFIVAFLAFGFVFYKAQTKIDNGELKDNNIEENEVDEASEENKETEEELNPIFPDDQKVLKEEHGNELCFLLMGIDKRDAGQKEMRGQRSDTMMLCKVNFDDGSIKMLSLPRDSIVKIRGKDDKLTHAHSYGGPALTLKEYDTLNGFLTSRLDRIPAEGEKPSIDQSGWHFQVLTIGNKKIESVLAKKLLEDRKNRMNEEGMETNDETADDPHGRNAP